ncbi:hypothetical protein PMIN03_012929 [Paraphaeosphaeria minitans]
MSQADNRTFADASQCDCRRCSLIPPSQEVSADAPVPSSCEEPPQEMDSAPSRLAQSRADGRTRQQAGQEGAEYFRVGFDLVDASAGSVLLSTTVLFLHLVFYIGYLSVIYILIADIGRRW